MRDEIGAAQVAYAKVHRKLVANQCIPPDGPIKVKGLSTIAGQPWLFRFPFGACDPKSLQAVSQAGLLAIQWDVSSGDPLRTLSPARMADAVVKGVRRGSIVLFHANGRGWSTAQALRMIIPRLRDEKYELVTVTELLNTEDAKPVRMPTCYDSRPGDTEHYDRLEDRLKAVYRRFKEDYERRHPPTAAAPPDASRAEQEPEIVPPKPVPAERKKEQGNRQPIDWKSTIYR